MQLKPVLRYSINIYLHSGMSPVGVRIPTSLSENSRLSAEEKRLARVMNLTSGDNKKVNWLTHS